MRVTSLSERVAWNIPSAPRHLQAGAHRVSTCTDASGHRWSWTKHPPQTAATGVLRFSGVKEQIPTFAFSSAREPATALFRIHVGHKGFRHLNDFRQPTSQELRHHTTPLARPTYEHIVGCIHAVGSPPPFVSLSLLPGSPAGRLHKFGHSSDMEKKFK